MVNDEEKTSNKTWKIYEEFIFIIVNIILQYSQYPQKLKEVLVFDSKKAYSPMSLHMGTLL